MNGMNGMIEWVVGGGIVTIIALVLTNNRAQDKKIDRNYSRLDQTKDYQDSTFTRKDICSVLHKQIDDKLDEIRTDIKSLLKQNGK